MQGTAGMLIRLLVIAVGTIVAFMGMRSDDTFLEIAGVVLLVVIAGWAMVDLFRARQRLVR